MLANDHTNAQRQLRPVLRHLGVSDLGRSRDDRNTLNQLARLRGAGFDQAFNTFMVTEHQQEIAQLLLQNPALLV